MLINTATDFSTALAYIQEEVDYTASNLSDDMKSSIFNDIFSEIEHNINVLYEKIRLLEDIRDYTKEFVIRAIQERRTKIIENLKIIETLTDEVNNGDYVATVIVPDTNAVILDRDGTEILAFENDGKTSVMPGTVLASETAVDIINKGPVKAVEVKKQDPVQGDYSAVDFVPLSGAEPFAICNLPLYNKEPYISIYRSDEPVKEGLQVQYDISFSGKLHSNYINFDPVNCEVIDITLFDADNISYSLTPEERYFPVKRIVKASVIVKCKDYERLTVAMPANQENDAFDSVINGDDIYG